MGCAARARDTHTHTPPHSDSHDHDHLTDDIHDNNEPPSFRSIGGARCRCRFSLVCVSVVETGPSHSGGLHTYLQAPSGEDGFRQVNGVGAGCFLRLALRQCRCKSLVVRRRELADRGPPGNLVGLHRYVKNLNCCSLEESSIDLHQTKRCYKQ